MTDEASTANDRRSTIGRVLTRLLWYGVPALAATAVAAYIVGAVVWHANPPIVPVEGVSMRPTLQAGDLVFLQGVDPNQIHKGDIIAVRVPSASRSKYGLPGEIVHRVVRIRDTPSGRVFVTKGDANPGNDVFTTPASDVVGREVAAAPGLGYPFLFFRSGQGKIFLAAVVVVGILYFLLGVFEERRAFSEGTAVAFETILAETNELKDALAGREPGVRAPPVGIAPVVTPSPPRTGSPQLDDLVEEVRDANASSKETSEVLQQLVGAIGEYGTHLKSHTEVMMNLAATTGELQKATARMGEAIAGAPDSPATVETDELPSVSSAPTEGPLPSSSEIAASPMPDAPPPSIKLKRFLGGYSRQSVETALAALTARVEQTEQRFLELERHSAELAHECDALRGELAAYRQLEQTLTDALAALPRRDRARADTPPGPT